MGPKYYIIGNYINLKKFEAYVAGLSNMLKYMKRSI